MQRLLIYHPECVETNGFFNQSVSIEMYILNPNNNKWYLAMYQNGYGSWKAKISEWFDSKDSTDTVGYFSTWDEFFIKSPKQQYNIPIISSTAYLTFNGAANHTVHWAWKQDSGDLLMENVAPSKIQLCLFSRIANGEYSERYRPMPFTFSKTSKNGIIELDEKCLNTHYTCFFDGIKYGDENMHLALQALQSPEPDAAIRLLGLISVVSKTCFEEQWVTGNEHNLYNIVLTIVGVDISYSSNVIPAYQIELMRHLFKQCKGWWYKGSEPDNKTVFRLLIP